MSTAALVLGNIPSNNARNDATEIEVKGAKLELFRAFIISFPSQAEIIDADRLGAKRKRLSVLNHPETTSINCDIASSFFC